MRALTTRLSPLMGFKFLCAFAALLGMSMAPQAQPAAEFYRGKNLQLIIGTGEGGGYDYSARLVAQFLADFIPGRPTIVPRNMPGAGSIAAAEYVYNLAPKDGLTMLIVQPTSCLKKSMIAPANMSRKSFHGSGASMKASSWASSGINPRRNRSPRRRRSRW